MDQNELLRQILSQLNPVPAPVVTTPVPLNEQVLPAPQAYAQTTTAPITPVVPAGGPAVSPEMLQAILAAMKAQKEATQAPVVKTQRDPYTTGEQLDEAVLNLQQRVAELEKTSFGTTHPHASESITE